MLNVQQEGFIQNIVKGMSQREAYKEAYNADTKSRINTMKLASLTQIYFPEMIDETIDYYNSLFLSFYPEFCSFYLMLLM